jgi:hydrogenase 3 maturation protease
VPALQAQNVLYCLIKTHFVKSWQEQLHEILACRIVFAGVGNRLKGDDGVGPLVIDRVKNKTAAVCFDTGVAPENYLEKICQQKPDTVIIIDATDFNGTPGEIRIFNDSEIAGGTLSTHALSLSMFCQYIKARLPTCHIFLIGIQPKSCILNDSLSEPIVKAINELQKELLL